jgi:putative acetyltransferase
MPISEVEDEADLRHARELLAEYFGSLAETYTALGLDLVAARRREVASLPGEYAPPGGRLLLAYSAGTPTGCVALRRLGPAVCELRRLYVRPALRGAGWGWRLTRAAIAAARAMSYERLRLNTLPSMDRARTIYGGLGFREIPPYRDFAVPGVICLELELPE